MKNYRLVPLLPVFSKIFERIIYNAMFKHYLDNDLIYSTQSSFKPADYCINEFNVITHNIFKGFDDGLEVAFYLISLRGGSRAAVTSKMECFVIIVNGFQPLTIFTKHSILGIEAALDPPLSS